MYSDQSAVRWESLGLGKFKSSIRDTCAINRVWSLFGIHVFDTNKRRSSRTRETELNEVDIHVAVFYLEVLCDYTDDRFVRDDTDIRWNDRTVFDSV